MSENGSEALTIVHSIVFVYIESQTTRRAMPLKKILFLWWHIAQ
jgi:hypothetical protein